MRETFKETKFRAESLELIEYCNGVITEYMADSLRLTLRQLYYQLVSANVISNTERSYKNLGNLVSKARLSGLMDWDAIEDRVRVPKVPVDWSSAMDAMETILYAFRLPRLRAQEIYMELWVEKDALAGVLAPIASEYHIVLMVNRGYSSQSAMYESAKRIEEAVHDNECERAVILYLGDLDPSGEDMVRDIKDRLTMFMDHEEKYSIPTNVNLTVEKVALNIDQVKEHDLPPNPAKLSDSRAKEFIKKYGPQSWEVDALPPKMLQEIIREDIDYYFDFEKYEAIKTKENTIKEAIKKAVKEL